jgi:GABA permease
LNDNHQPTKRRILVVANTTADGSTLHKAIRDRIRDSEAEVLVIATALDSSPSDWTSHEAFGDAEARLRDSLDLLDSAGIEANGVVGDGDPLRAIADVLHGFPADEVVLATHTAARSRSLSRRVQVAVEPLHREGLAVRRRLH